MLEIDSTGLMIIGFDWKMRCVFTKLVWGCCWSCGGETSSSCKVDSIIGIGWVIVNLDCLIVAEVEEIFERERAFWNKHIPNVRNWQHRTNDIWFRLKNALCFHKTGLRLLLKLWWRNQFLLQSWLHYWNWLGKLWLLNCCWDGSNFREIKSILKQTHPEC